MNEQRGERGFKLRPREPRLIRRNLARSERRRRRALPAPVGPAFWALTRAEVGPGAGRRSGRRLPWLAALVLVLSYLAGGAALAG
jgi:hypothetical protein